MSVTSRQGAASAADGLADAHGEMLGLSHTIEHEIIPRLMLAHRSGSYARQHESVCPLEPHAGDGAARALALESVQPFVHLLLEADQEAVEHFVTTLRQRGVPLPIVYLHLLAPAARYVGELWVQDLCSFTDVTVASGRLQQLLRELSLVPGHAPARQVDGRRLLLLPAPREQHSLGLLMAAEFFRCAGWEVAGGPLDLGEDPARTVAREWFDVVGFSLAASLHADELARTMAAVRRSSRNPQVCVVLGGPMVMYDPTTAASLGADLCLSDAAEAPQTVARYLAERGHVN